MRYVLLASAVLAMTATVAEARCTQEDARRALQNLQSYVNEYPWKRDAVERMMQQVRAEYGNPSSYQMTCEIVRVVFERLNPGGR